MKSSELTDLLPGFNEYRDVIELAIAGNASQIVTRNLKDFRKSQLKFPQLKIRTPEQILGD